MVRTLPIRCHKLTEFVWNPHKYWGYFRKILFKLNCGKCILCTLIAYFAVLSQFFQHFHLLFFSSHCLVVILLSRIYFSLPYFTTKKERYSISFTRSIFLLVALQHYFLGKINVPVFVWFIFGSWSGTLIINSSNRHSSASQIKSKCSSFTLSANSWYNSLIVFGRIPVARAKSACVHRNSPNLVDSKILIIYHCPFHHTLLQFNIIWVKMI